MIGSGEERAKYQEFVKDFTKIFDDSEGSEVDRDIYNVSVDMHFQYV